MYIEWVASALQLYVESVFTAALAGFCMSLALTEQLVVFMLTLGA